HGVANRIEDVEREDAFRRPRALVAQRRTLRQQPLVDRLLNPEAGGGDRELASRRQVVAVRDGEERKWSELHAREARLRVERGIEHEMPALVHHEADGAPGKELHSLDHGLPMLLSL